jgi:cyclic pyranopterin phosphate synthase
MLLSPPSPRLAQDPFGRRFPYLRLSVTEVCNFRCTYCLPDGHAKRDGDELSMEEVRRLVAAFAALGTHKIRLTGGEPTLRADFTELAAAVASIDGIRSVVMTTNGYRLRERAADFFAAGISGLNVSVDSLDPNVFRSLTGHDRLTEILLGIDRALEVGFAQVKLNAVLLRGINDDGLPAFLGLVKDRPLSLRFIELMQTRDNADYFRLHHRSASVIRDQLSARGWSRRSRQDDAGPAEVFEHPDYQGTIGLIAPYESGFCDTCNRLRVTARGELHLCLFGEHGHDLRPLLQRGDQLSALTDRIEGALQLKRSGHFLREGDPGIRGHFAAIGG